LKIIPKIGVSGTKRICETLKKFFCIWFIKFTSSYKKLELKNKYWVKIWKMIFFQISKIFKFWSEIYFSIPIFCKCLWILWIICKNIFYVWQILIMPEITKNSDEKCCVDRSPEVPKRYWNKTFL
jgi:hypothetical protein